MKATELRIGNYLMGNQDKPVIVTRIFDEDRIGIGGGDPYTVSGDNPCLLPIPLTEEWLVKFQGYEQRPAFATNEDIMHDLDGMVIYATKKGYRGGSEFAFADESRLQYVHQLQNLYFALTGKELEI